MKSLNKTALCRLAVVAAVLLLAPAIKAQESEKSRPNNDKVGAGIEVKQVTSDQPATGKQAGHASGNASAQADRTVSTETTPVADGSEINSDGGRVLRAEQWELARSGESIIQLPVINTVVKRWLADTDKRIEILYPGGEEGEFWVQELSDWLVALGIPAKHLRLVVGSGVEDEIRFNLVR